MGDNIKAEIRERMALGPADGQGMRLVASGGHGRGAEHAARWCTAHVPECGEVLGDPEFAGRADDGSLVFLVTFALHELAVPIGEIERVLDAKGTAVVSGDRQVQAARRIVATGRAFWQIKATDHGTIARTETRTAAP
jgi:hypothetical protein